MSRLVRLFLFCFAIAAHAAQPEKAAKPVTELAPVSGTGVGVGSSAGASAGATSSLSGEAIPNRGGFAEAQMDLLDLEEEQNISRLSFVVGSGSSGLVTSSLDFDLGLQGGSRLGLGVGGSWGKTADGPLQTNSARASYGTDPLELFSISGTYERWGQFTVIETETFRTGLALSADKFFMEVSPEYRTIAWFAQASLQSSRRIYSSSIGVTGRASITGLGPLGLSISGSKYWYKDIPSNFDSLAIVGFVSNTSLDAGASFLGSSGSANLNWRFSKASIGIGYSQSQSFIDGYVGFGGLMSFDYSPNLDWSYGLTAGQNWSDPSRPPSYFGEGAISLTW